MREMEKNPKAVVRSSLDDTCALRNLGSRQQTSAHKQRELLERRFHQIKEASR